MAAVYHYHAPIERRVSDSLRVVTVCTESTYANRWNENNLVFFTYKGEERWVGYLASSVAATEENIMGNSVGNYQSLIEKWQQNRECPIIL